MWRREGAGELYTYLPPGIDANTKVCSVPPESDCNDTFGQSVGRGSFSFTPGTRTTIGQRVRLNHPGAENGELELFVNGKSMFSVTGLVLANTDAGRIRGIQMQSFFGGECARAARCLVVPRGADGFMRATGNDASWASPKDQNVFFGDFTVAITEKL